MSEYDHQAIEKKWRERWEKAGIYQPNLTRAGKPFYNLMMFPYPSAEGLHVGNMYAFTGADIYGRYKRMQGYNVFEPIGLDGFGIHSENYAIKIGKHPAEQANVSQKRFYQQLRDIGNGFSWDHSLETYDPAYYKWTQWLFIQMFKNGLAVQKSSWVNWCPHCKTVLADEQVEGGVCERCKTETTRKEAEQWFFKITKYADRLLNNIDGQNNLTRNSTVKNKYYRPVGKDYEPQLEGLRWPEKIKIAQRQWIGRKQGIDIVYPIKGHKRTVRCFTTRPDTNFGATFVVLAPEHPLIEEILQGKFDLDTKMISKIKAYVGTALRKTEQQRKKEERKKTGVFTGLYAVNQLNGYEMPIWISDFVLMEVGTGAVVGVPGHDRRDFEFAKVFDLEVKRVVVASDGDASEIEKVDQVQEDDGFMVNSRFLNGMDIHTATEKVMKHLEENGWGERTFSYHLRDWLISRQRYWGPPIPMVFCGSCAEKGRTFNAKVSKTMAGWYPVPEKNLPIELPEMSNADVQPTGDGKAPLEKAPDSWVYTNCPKCGERAKRETDVSDTFLDSAWYFLAYPNLQTNQWKGHEKPLNARITKKWFPVDVYIGGAEHAVLHLLYSRFVTMAMHDWGLLEFEEPFPFLYSHGLIIKEGAKMSKSRGNIVVPDDYIKKYGADTLRMYLMFIGPYDRGGDFRDSGIHGMSRFLRRVWRLYQESKGKIGRRSDKNLEEQLHRTTKKIGEDLDKLKYNTAIAAMMEFVNSWELGEAISYDDAGLFLKIMAPFAPHMSEELWQALKRAELSSQKSVRFRSIHVESWPTHNRSLLREHNVEIVIQVNGKLRDRVVVSSAKARKRTTIIGLAKQLPGVKRYLEKKPIKNIVWVPGKLVNFVVN